MIVEFELNRIVIDCKATFRDPVGITPDRRSIIARVLQVIGNAVETEYDIVHRTAFAGCQYRNHTPSVIGHADLHTGSVRQPVQIGFLSVHLGLEIASFQSGCRYLILRLRRAGQQAGHSRKQHDSLHNIGLKVRCRSLRL